MEKIVNSINIGYCDSKYKLQVFTYNGKDFEIAEDGKIKRLLPNNYSHLTFTAPNEKLANGVNEKHCKEQVKSIKPPSGVCSKSGKRPLGASDEQPERKKQKLHHELENGAGSAEQRAYKCSFPSAEFFSRLTDGDNESTKPLSRVSKSGKRILKDSGDKKSTKKKGKSSPSKCKKNGHPQ